MAQGKRTNLSTAQRADIWVRWKAGESLHEIGRAFGLPHTSIHCLLSHHGGIVPAARRRSLLALTLAEREGISRELASGSSVIRLESGPDLVAKAVQSPGESALRSGPKRQL